jgi:inner membrane protein
VFVGHLPAGYLVTRGRARSHPHTVGTSAASALARLAASVLPDLDLLWFYLVNARRHVHHSYLPHLPGFWLLVLAALSAILALRRPGRAAWLGLAVLGANVLAHLLLDTIAGGIRWLWPMTDAEFVLVTVEPRYRPWYLNFLLHWTFALELALVGAAAWVWWRRRNGAHRLVHGATNSA